MKNLNYIDNRGKGSMSKRWEAMESYLKVDKQLKILDIGCNTGYFSFLAQTLGHDVTGIDIDEECIDATNKIIEKTKINNIKFELLTVPLLEYLKKQPTNHYDYIFYLSVHHHVFEQFGIKVATLIIKELSRIGKNMFFDMGQTNEKNNGYLTWLKHIPKMPIPEKSIIAHTFLFSDFKYGKAISSTTIHEAERILFIFTKKEPRKELTIKELTINNKKYFVDRYVWKEIGSKGRIFISTKAFPTFSYKMNSKRYYMAHDSENKKYFIKEMLFNPEQDAIEYSRLEYERGQKIKHIPNTSPAIDIDKNFLVFNFFSMTHLGNVYVSGDDIPDGLKRNAINTIGEIQKVLHSYDSNLNNVLCLKGDYRIIDFEPAKLGDGYNTWEDRIVDLKRVLKVKEK